MHAINDAVPERNRFGDRLFGFRDGSASVAMTQRVLNSLSCTAIALFQASMPCAYAETGDQGWSTYHNPATGIVVQYPAKVFSVEAGPAETGSGSKFRTPDGRAGLMIYTLPNTEGETPRGYLRNHLGKGQWSFEYRRVTDRFFAVSGIKQDTTIYSRCNFSNARSIQCIYLEYPAAEDRAWDAIVTRISLSLRG